MPYCRKCGTKLSEGAKFCSKCGTPGETLEKQRLASWGERIIAWLIDIVILGAVLTVIKWTTMWAAWPSFAWAPSYFRWIPFVDFGLDNVIYFFYWMLMEGTYGQSIGKMIMKIKVTQLSSDSINLVQATIESVGKAFLLPIDCLVGWILYSRTKQRLFNYLSETLVVRTSR